ILLLDACLLLATVALAAPGPASPVFHALRIARLWSSKHAQCTLADVVRCERSRTDPAQAPTLASVHPIREDGELDLVATPLGNFLIHRKDTPMLTGMVSEQTQGVYDIAGYGVHEGDVVLDCGANIGVYARHALALGARLVVAIEPAADNLPLLRRNLAAEIE